jgi:hypothetical protein
MIAEIILHLDFFWPSVGDFIWEMAFFGLGVIFGYIINDIRKKAKNDSR